VHIELIAIASTLPSKCTPLDLSQVPVPAVNQAAERKIKVLEAELARSKKRSPPGDTISSKLLFATCSEAADSTAEQNLQQALDLQRAHLWPTRIKRQESTKLSNSRVTKTSQLCMSHEPQNIKYFTGAWALGNGRILPAAVSLTTGNEYQLHCPIIWQHLPTRTTTHVAAHNVNGGSFTDSLVRSERACGCLVRRRSIVAIDLHSMFRDLTE